MCPLSKVKDRNWTLEFINEVPTSFYEDVIYYWKWISTVSTKACGMERNAMKN